MHAWQIRSPKKNSEQWLQIMAYKYFAEDWKVASYVALLPEQTWSKRVFPYHRRQGRFKPTLMRWDTVKQHFAPWQHLGNSICLFFFSALFSRRRSGWHCFSGELPGMYNLYTGGYRCARRRAKSKPLLLRCGQGLGWQLGGRRPRRAHRW